MQILTPVARSSYCVVLKISALLLLSLCSQAALAVDELPELSDRTADVLAGLPNDDSVKTLNIADFDNDGPTDVVIARRGLSPILLINEAGILTNRTSEFFGAAATANDSTYVETLDANNDGLIDLAFAVLDQPVRLFLNLGSANGQWQGFDNGVDLPSAINALTVESGDIRGDGTPDDLLVNQVRENNVLLLNDGTGSFVDASEQLDTLQTLTQGHFVLVDDANADGVDDIMHIEADDNLFVYYNDGSGTFSQARSKSFQNTNFGQPLAYTCGCGDYNGDGIFDFAVHADGGGDDRLTSFMSTGVIDENGIPEHIFVDQVGVPQRLSRRHGLGHNGDIDGDGDLDYVQSSLERVHGTLSLRPIGVRTLIVINTGIDSGIFEGHSEGSWAQQDSHDMKFIDVNSDGNLDLFVGHDSRYGVYINDAAPSNIELDANIVVTPTQTGDIVFFEVDLASGTATTYAWEFGDGTTLTTSVPQAQHTYSDAGSYSVTVTAIGPNGSDQLNFQQTIHNPLTLISPISSTGMIYQPVSASDDRVFVANPDNDSLTVVSGTSGNFIQEIPVGIDPRSLSLGSDGRLYVVNKGNATLAVVNTDTLQVLEVQALPHASRPHGIVVDPQANIAYIALEASKEIIKWDVSLGESLGTIATGNVPRELALSADRSKLYAPIFITEPLAGESTRTVGAAIGAEVLVINPQSMSLISSVNIAANDINAETEDAVISSRGIPNYLRAPAISPDGLTAVIPAKIDNIFRGLMRDGRARAHDKLVRAAMLKLDISTDEELVNDRLDFDNNSPPTALAYGPTGNFIFSVHEGSRAFEILDAHSNAELFRTTTEFAPRSVVVSPDGNRVFIHNYLSRSISLFDTEALMSGLRSDATLVGVTEVVRGEKLSEQVLLGKQLFHDSEDNRLSTQGYISCAACHDDAGHDGRVWDFSDAGEGLRNTIDLRGRAAIGNGNVHWSANFDEFHDFENDIREIFDGIGLLSDADFSQTAAPLDAVNPKAGRSTDLDALAAYGASLNTFHLSPFRRADGQLTAAGSRGKQLFAQYNCAACHSGTAFTDSPAGQTHDIGTIDVDTGGRLGMPLLNGGLDTPTLRGLWDGAPYLHDGKAQTLQDAVLAHTKGVSVDHASLSASELNDLANYLTQIDDNELSAPEGTTIDENTSPPITNAISNPVNDGGSVELSVTDLTINDWLSLEAYPVDSPNSITGNNTLDITQSWLAHDQTHLYIRYDTVNPVIDTWGLNVHFDTDNNRSTGFVGFEDDLPIGIDYMIEGGILYQYSGNGRDFSWTAVQALENMILNTSRELRVPRLGMGNPSAMRLFFYADNASVGGQLVDGYPDSIAVESQEIDTRSFSYSFGEVVDNPTQPPTTPSDSITRSNFVSNITVDGNLNEWQSLESFGQDANDVSGSVNTIDWLEAWMGHNDSTLYIAWKNDGPVDITWGNGIMLDTDQSSQTGYIGFQDNLPIGIDNLIEDSSVYRYTGSGFNWAWQYVGEVDIALGADSIEMAVPNQFLSAATEMDLFFIGNNLAVGGAAVDYFPDNVTGQPGLVGERLFRYSFAANAVNGGDSNSVRAGDSSLDKSNAISSGAGSVSLLWLLVSMGVILWRKAVHLVTIAYRHKKMSNYTRRISALFFVLLLTACDGVVVGGILGNVTAGSDSANNNLDGLQPSNNPSLPNSVELGAALGSLDYTSELSNIRLAGSLVNPPVATRSQGVVSVVVNSVTNVITGSVRHSVPDATEATIHIGQLGENGPVVVALNLVDQSEFSIPDGTELSDEQVAAYSAGNFYIIVSSAQHASGEIRAQLSAAPLMSAVEANLDDIQVKVLSPNCSGCHFGGGETLPSSMDLTSAASSFNMLVNNPSKQDPNKMLVLPGVAQESYLLDKLLGRQVVGSQMPFRGVPLDSETIDAITTWVNQGAARF